MVLHENKALSPTGLRSVGARDGASIGYILRKHRYPARILGSMLVRPVGGLLRAIAMRDGPGAGLPLIEALLADGQLQDYHLAHAARADICRRLGRHADARASYERALALARQGPEREFLGARLRDLPADVDPVRRGSTST